MDEEWEIMRETEAVLRSTQLLSMSLQTNTLAAADVSPLLVCFAQSKLLRDPSDPNRKLCKAHFSCSFQLL